MRIIYGDKIMKLAWLPVLAFFIIAILPNELGNTILQGPLDPITGEQPEPPKKLISMLALGVTLLRMRRLSPFAMRIFMLGMAYILVMSLESFYKYGHPFMYPHVFGKFFVLFSFTATYIIFRSAKEEIFTASLILLAGIFMFDIFAFYPQVLSIGSFMNIERGLHAGCVSLLMAVWLYAFNSYLPKQQPMWLAFFFVLTAFIIFLNHRTVWLSSTTAMTLTLLVSLRKGKEKYPLAAFSPVVIVPIIAVMLVSAYVFSEKPELLANLTDRVMDIEKVNERGTGKWRLEQLQSYLPFVLDHPFFGMRFEGFLLPVQFFHEDTHKQIFVADTGHHFHSFYMDSMFYVGFVGLAILSSVLVYPFIKVVRLPVKVPIRLVGLSVWTLAALQYGLSYPVDDFHFAMAGFTLAAIDTYLEKVDYQRAMGIPIDAEPEAKKRFSLPVKLPKPKKIKIHV